MKDKDKIIEEMAKVNCEKCSFCDDCDKCKFQWHEDCEKIKNASVFYNAGYRKLPKDSVVLSREEYDKLKLFEERVRSGVCFTQKEWFDYINKDSNHRTSLQIKAKEEGSKETAEKIIKFLDDYCDCDSAYLVEQAKEYVAKLLGVEIKE